jgi:hypothetical protein
MRFPMLVLATAIAALACEKGAPLSNSRANLEPTPAAASATAVSVTAASVPAVSAAAAPQAGTEAKAGTPSPASAPTGVAAAVTPAAIAPAATRDALQSAQRNSRPLQPSAASDEGNGEPMDDVDDEEVSATDKSGAGAVTHDESADDSPSGPVDDSEGADIELRE